MHKKVAQALTLFVLLFVLSALAWKRKNADAIFIAGLGLLLITGVLSPSEALKGFANEGLATIAVIFIVVAGLRDTGATQWISSLILNRPRNVRWAQLQITAPSALFSAFLNNIPVVAMLIPVVEDWARKSEIAPSRLLMPLSYSAILGGCCTIIGTSTTLIVNGYLLNIANRATEGLGDTRGLAFFEIGIVGVPITLAGLALMALTGSKLFPTRASFRKQIENPREYSVEMIVERKSPLVGKTVEKAGLRHLSGSFLAEIRRIDQNHEERVISVEPEQKVRAEDRLIFFGGPEAFVELQKIPGLRPANDQVFKLIGNRPQRVMAEAVVSENCPLVGKTIREGKFRHHYGAVILAIARNGQRLEAKPGDIVLQAGDTLLLEAKPTFLQKYEKSRDFHLISSLQDSSPLRHDRAAYALLILFGMVGLATFTTFSLLQAGFMAAAAMILTRCTTIQSARQRIDWSLLVMIGAALGIGAAMEKTGLAALFASSLIDWAGGDPLASLAAIYLATTVLTALVTNHATAVMMLPIGLVTAQDLGVSFLPFAVAIAISASASFLTPMGYQTNLMIFGPGGYRFRDYLYAGIPLTLLTGAITIGIIPQVWEF